ncbi:MAG: protein kinase domain-containing protein [Gemmataceae bacterium]
MAWRLYVVDGADVRKSFVLPTQGKITIGRGQKHADIILHDLLVSRVHCELEIDGDNILVTPSADVPAGTLINGAKIKEPQPLRAGEILRVGNTHMKLEPHEPGSDTEVEEVDGVEEAKEPHKLPHLPFNRLEELSGELLGHYQLNEVLGRGHHGVVFQAENRKNGQIQALKVLSPEFPASAAEQQRFTLALKKLGPLRHPNLVSLLNAGKTGPYCWLASEFVEGNSLAETLRDADAKKRSHWKQALRMAIHLGQALEFLHEQRIIHGGITPTNVLLGQDEKGRSKLTKLSDLVLAPALARSSLLEAHREEKLASELGYLAPERIEGGSPDFLTDLYGLGAVVYARLTGAPPFQGRNSADVLDQVQTSMPRKPGDIHRNIPDRLSASVMMLIARRPEDRYQTARDVLRDLLPLAEEEGVVV